VGLVVGGVLAVLLVACGGGGSKAQETPTPEVTTARAVVDASETPEVDSTPRPTSTPYSATEPAPSGRVNTTFSVNCVLGALGPEIKVGYNVSITNTDASEATLTGVKLYIDGVLREDNSPLSTKTFIKESTFGGVGRRVYALQIHVETWAAPQPRDIVEFAQCPAAPDRPVA
jgi:hypothetical protein